MITREIMGPDLPAGSTHKGPAPAAEGRVIRMKVQTIGIGAAPVHLDKSHCAIIEFGDVEGLAGFFAAKATELGEHLLGCAIEAAATRERDG